MPLLAFPIEEKVMKNIALIATVLFATSSFAHAEDVTTVRGPSTLVEHVPYQSSELATASGIRDLRLRVRQAADRLCAPSSEALLVRYKRLNCTAPAERDAYAQVDRAVAQWRSGTQASADRITVRAR
jgi:UrcA family protein